MTMTESLMSIAPNTTKMFSYYLMESYGLSMKEFESTVPKRKFYEVSRFFGYPLEENTDKPVDQIIAFIKSLFEEYESLMMKYPDGVPDGLKILKEMNHQQREVWIKKNFVSTIRISLKHALVPGNNIIRITLRDSLIKRLMSALELEIKEKREKDIADNLFWENIIKNFDRNEIVPF